ncbi:hypothetical protein EVG20_g5249 [Dentipellis fragilis]|uniref:Uncharacterized protein n=1 Tax=Dentipellis fragilis TaxID=205917 RepID=A0A4Y9YVS4_9AGAM|nr:hypothetical protein EVG20_g5249 [Dentipellis fragilis]
MRALAARARPFASDVQTRTDKQPPKHGRADPTQGRGSDPRSLARTLLAPHGFSALSRAIHRAPLPPRSAQAPKPACARVAVPFQFPSPYASTCTAVLARLAVAVTARRFRVSSRDVWARARLWTPMSMSMSS